MTKYKHWVFVLQAPKAAASIVFILLTLGCWYRSEPVRVVAPHIDAVDAAVSLPPETAFTVREDTRNAEGTQDAYAYIAERTDAEGGAWKQPICRSNVRLKCQFFWASDRFCLLSVALHKRPSGASPVVPEIRLGEGESEQLVRGAPLECVEADMEHETTLVEVALDSSSGQILKVTPVVCNGWLYGSAENMKGFYSYWKHDHTFFPCESPERIELFLKRALPLERNAYYVLKVDASGTIDWLLELSGLTKVPFASIVPAKGGFTWLVGTYEGVLNVQEKELVSSVNDGMRESFVLRVSPKGEVVYAATFPQFPKKGSFGFQGTFGLSDGGLLLIDEFAGAATLEGCGDAAFELQSSPLETGVSAMAFRDTGCIVWAKELILGRPLLVNLHTAPGGALILTGKKGRRYSEDFKVLFQGPSTAE